MVKISRKVHMGERQPVDEMVDASSSLPLGEIGLLSVKRE